MKRFSYVYLNLRIKMGRLLMSLSVFVLGLINISLVLADEADGCFGDVGGMMSGSYGMGTMGFGWLISLLVVIALVLLIIWLIKQVQKK